MTLHVTNEEDEGVRIHFRLFGTDHVLVPRTLSNLLGFSPLCVLSIDSQNFVARDFWEEITGTAGRGKHSITLIHNPTLRFLSRWIASVVFPREDTRCIQIQELKLLHAMCRKRKVSPVMNLVEYWMGLVKSDAPITMTSLVTRIARGLGVLEDAQLVYIPYNPALLIRVDHFVQGHFLREKPDRSLSMIYRGHNVEFPLPAPQFSLYQVEELTMQLTEPARQHCRSTYSSTNPASTRSCCWSSPSADTTRFVL